jgi:ABC-type phosphate transport system substrate-binding protein
MPYLFACNPAVFGVHNITRDQAALLFTSSGAVPGQSFQGMSAAYLGGVATSPLYLIGGDINSGTRRNIEKNIGFPGSEILWATNSLGQYFITNGFSSEANVASLIANLPATIGYLDWQDYLSVSNQVVPLAFNGVACTPAATANGNYELWSYLRFWRPGEGGPMLQANLGTAMINCLTNSAFETGPVIQNGIIPMPSMQVWRGSGQGDAGDQIYPLNY